MRGGRQRARCPSGARGRNHKFPGHRSRRSRVRPARGQAPAARGLQQASSARRQSPAQQRPSGHAHPSCTPECPSPLSQPRVPLASPTVPLASPTAPLAHTRHCTPCWAGSVGQAGRPSAVFQVHPACRELQARLPCPPARARHRWAPSMFKNEPFFQRGRVRGVVSARFAFADEVLRGLVLKFQLSRVLPLLFLYKHTEMYVGRNKRDL